MTENLHLWALTFAALHVLGIFHACHALMHTRTPQGTVAWVACLLSVPWAAIPLYWILGRHRFHGYIDARRDADSPISEQFSKVVAQLENERNFDSCPPEDLTLLTEKLGGLPTTDRNEVQLLINGAKTYEAMFEVIANARDYLLIEFFIVEGDRVGQRFRDALIERAAAGVRVYFLFDEVGSRKLPKSYVHDLRSSGVFIEPFGTTRGTGNRFQVIFRNHRKILVADGKVALVGGLNIGAEYTGSDSRFGSWRDTHLLLRGGAAAAVQLAFLGDWNWAAGKPPAGMRWKSASEDNVAAGEKRVTVFASSPADQLDSCHLFFLAAIAGSKERIWLTSPYFVPDGAMVAALQTAAVRGVDVRILLPNRADHLLVYLTAYSYLEEMEEAGVQVFRYQSGFLHQKVMLIDDALASVGTPNLDNRSFRLNFEILALVEDEEFANEVHAMLESDFEDALPAPATEYTARPLWFKVAVRMARILAPMQ